MLYDVYEVVNLDESDESKQVVDRFYQASEPMYDTFQLVQATKKRIETQLGLTNVKVINRGQTENVGGELPGV